MGTQSVFIDNANEQHNIILLKHFTEKNRAAVVDVKTRKRRTGEGKIQSKHGCHNMALKLSLIIIVCRKLFSARFFFSETQEECCKLKML